jgi:hypothetical protein
MNHDGSMTVSNFHHNPKLYRPPVDYEIPASEPPKLEDMAADIGGGLSPYATENSDLTNFNNQLYSNFAQEIPVTEPSIETADNQGYADPNADLANLLLGAARSGVEEAPNQKFEPTRGYGKGAHYEKDVPETVQQQPAYGTNGLHSVHQRKDLGLIQILLFELYITLI